MINKYGLEKSIRHQYVIRYDKEMKTLQKIIFTANVSLYIGLITAPYNSKKWSHYDS